MADAALGGKTGINTPQGKNLVGTFHHPEEVVHWVGALSTLDRRERRSGWAEITKSCLLAGEDAFSWLEGHAAAGAAGDPTVLAEAVDRACRLKADVVTRDPHESGLRRVLNLGHTLGHAAEHALGYGALTHGEAVSMGLCAALELGVWLGVTRDAGLPDRVQAVLDTFSLPTRLPLLPWSTWSAALASDKKQTRDGLQWVLLQAPGEPLLHRVPSATLQGWLQDPSRARSALADPRS
jgi:3-dehydroquinate synthetase